MSDEIPLGVLNAAEGSPRPSWWTRDASRWGCGLGGHRLEGFLAGAVGGDVGAPGLAAGDDGVQLPQDRGGDHGLGLDRFELVGLTGGQVPVAGGVDAVVL